MSEQNTQAIQQLSNEFNAFQDGTIEVSNLSDAAKKLIKDTLFPEGVIIHIDNPLKESGDYLFGKKAGINNGNFFMGWKSNTVNPTEDSHFSEKGFAK